ncbi:MAG: SDR family oxidoreductase [Pseudomonadota bacterium]
MSFSIEGKTAIITGAANGIGLAIARQFADVGARVVLADMDEDKLKLEEGAMRDAGAEVQRFSGDLREKLTLANLLSATLDNFDRVDVLVNASRQVLESDALNPKADNFDAMWKQNVLSNFRLTQLIAKRFEQQAIEDDDFAGDVGSIINLTSIASERAHPDLLAYSVSCAALNQLTRSLAVALAPRRVRVNAISIGSVMSASLQSVLSDDTDLRNLVADVTPMGYIAEADAVAEAAQFLASTASRFITGQIVTIDGGRTLIDPAATAFH